MADGIGRAGGDLGSHGVVARDLCTTSLACATTKIAGVVRSWTEGVCVPCGRHLGARSASSWDNLAHFWWCRVALKADIMFLSHYLIMVSVVYLVFGLCLA